jgi:hypothetical protein
VIVSTVAEAACVVNIVGKWQQTHTMIQERRIPDESQAWTFKRDGSMRFVKTKPALTVDGKYQCEGDTISLFGRMTNQFKIVAHDADSMTWESKLGGTLLVKRVDR